MAKIVVLGPGALGLIFAARLSNAGHEVTLGVRSAKRATDFAGELTIQGDHATTAQVPASHKALSSDVLVVATKRHDIANISRKWAKRCSGPIVVLQNGLPQPEMDALGEIVHCSVWFPASIRGPTTSDQTGPGNLHLAHPDLAVLEQISSLLSPIAPVQCHTEIMELKWSKLLVNSCITGMGAVMGVSLGELLSKPAARDLFLQVVQEGFQVAKAEGISPPRINQFSPRFFASKGPRLLQHLALRVLARKLRRQESSSLQSLSKAEKTEVDALNGTISELGKRHGIATPVNDLIWDLAKHIEEGVLEPSITNLNTFTDLSQGL